MGHGPTALSTLCDTLREQRDVATTTIATMLRVMLDKGARPPPVRVPGAARSGRPAVTQKKTAKRMVGKLVDHVFDGSADRLARSFDRGRSAIGWPTLQNYVS